MIESMHSAKLVVSCRSAGGVGQLSVRRHVGTFGEIVLGGVVGSFVLPRSLVAFVLPKRVGEHDGLHPKEDDLARVPLFPLCFPCLAFVFNMFIL